MSRVSIQQIATVAGVSPRTVSNALRRVEKGERSDAIQRAKQIRRIARDLGYRPNAAARSMRSGKHNALGLVQSRHAGASGVDHGMLWNIQEEMARSDLHLVMGQIHDQQLSNSRDLPRLLREWSVDGLIVMYSVGAPQRLAQIIDEMRMPAVWANVKQEQNAIYPDDVSAGREATRRLLEAGHRRIAFLAPSGPIIDFSPEWSHRAGQHFSVDDRYAGYRLEMEAAGLPPQRLDWPRADKGMSDYQRAGELLTTADRPTAIVSYIGGDVCLAFADAGRDLDLRIPDDLSYITFAPHQRSLGRLRPDFMRVPLSEMGKQAVRILEQKIGSGHSRWPSVVLSAEYQAGNTIAPPPN